MKYINPDNEEKNIDIDFVDGKFKSVANTKKAISRYQKFTRATLEKTKNIKSHGKN